MANLMSGNNNDAIKLLKALGVNLPVLKAVLVIDIKDTVKLYLKTLATVEQVRGLTAAVEGMEIVPVEDVDVSDDCQVTFTPR